jgi:hypothetical protein
LAIGIPVPVAVVMSVILVFVCCKRKKRSLPVDDTTRHSFDPPTVMGPHTITTDGVIYGKTVDDYWRTEPVSKLQPAVSSLERESSWSTMELSGDESQSREAEEMREEIIGELKVLVVYSLRLTEAQREDILNNLIGRLHKEYRGIEPVSHDTVPMKKQQSIWLQEEMPTADKILCVCTESSRLEWEDKSTMLGAVRMVIEAKTCKNEEYSNFAVVLLKADDREHIPYPLSRNLSFAIDDCHAIASYVTGIPPYVLPHEQRP